MNARTVFLCGALAALAGAASSVAPLAAQHVPDGFHELDLERRWLAYLGDTRDATDEHRAKWLALLADRRDFELLEWIAVYDLDPRRGGAKPSALSLLAEADAPQWMRVAAWFAYGSPRQVPAAPMPAPAGSPAMPIVIRRPDSHSRDEALALLADNRELFLGWFDAHPGGPNARLRWLADALREEAEPAHAGARYLAPLDPAPLLLGWLDAPAVVPVMDPAKPPQPGVRYLHQVTRTIRGLAGSAFHEGIYLAKLRRLARHPNDVIRRETYLAFTGFAPDAIPFADFAAVVRDRDAPAADRSLAAMAASYSDHPGAFLLLHEILGDLAHPARDVAISRLGEIGTGYTRDVFRRLRATSDDPQARLVRRAHRSMLERLNGLRADGHARQLRAMLERAAYAELRSGDPLPGFRAWTASFLGGFRGPNLAVLAPVLTELRDSYEPRVGLTDDPAALRAGVRALAAAILDAGGGGR